MIIKKTSNKELKKYLRKEGHPQICEYCNIDEKDFNKIWGEFYGGNRQVLELEHKDGDKSNNKKENLTLACPLCNNAKTNKLTYEEMKQVGEVIKKIWINRKSSQRN